MVEKNEMKIKVKLLMPVLCAIPLETRALPMKRGHKLVQTLSFSHPAQPGSSSRVHVCLLGHSLAPVLLLPSCCPAHALPHPPRNGPHTDHPPPCPSIGLCRSLGKLILGKEEMTGLTFPTFL